MSLPLQRRQSVPVAFTSPTARKLFAREGIHALPAASASFEKCLIFFFAAAVALLLAPSAFGQLAGRTGADGPFVVDSAEDLDLRCESLGRDWVSDFVNSHKVLYAVDPAALGLITAEGQSGLGVLNANVPDDGFGTIQGGFGVPMPGVAGASTLDAPGDVTSFNYLTFYACHKPGGLADAKFQVLLECYPQNADGTFPTLVWNYESPASSAFARIGLVLDRPSGVIQNPSGRTVQELLGATRYLYFLHFASPVPRLTTLNAWIDDITLDADPPFAQSRGEWVLYE